MKHALMLSLAAGMVLAVCTGCQKFTKQRYEMVYLGMPQQEVEMSLGEPAAKFSDSWSYLHEDPFYKAVIKFDADGKVIDKAWYDEHEMGTHPDAKTPPAKTGTISTERRSVKVD